MHEEQRCGDVYVVEDNGRGEPIDYATGDCTHPLPICLPRLSTVPARKKPERTALHGTRSKSGDDRKWYPEVRKSTRNITEGGNAMVTPIYRCEQLPIWVGEGRAICISKRRQGGSLPKCTPQEYVETTSGGDCRTHKGVCYLIRSRLPANGALVPVLRDSEEETTQSMRDAIDRAAQ